MSITHVHRWSLDYRPLLELLVYGTGFKEYVIHFRARTFNDVRRRRAALLPVSYDGKPILRDSPLGLSSSNSLSRAVFEWSPARQQHEGLP